MSHICECVSLQCVLVGSPACAVVKVNAQVLTKLSIILGLCCLASLVPFPTSWLGAGSLEYPKAPLTATPGGATPSHLLNCTPKWVSQLCSAPNTFWSDTHTQYLSSCSSNPSKTPYHCLLFQWNDPTGALECADDFIPCHLLHTA